jgi:hypothetical protein
MREDLLPITETIAKENGWTIIERQPFYSRKFAKENLTVWRCIHNGIPSWAKARLVDGMYTDHEYNTDIHKLLV